MDTTNLKARGVSVIMPVHNGGDYLETSVGSILHQSHSNLELIIIDDNSRDSAIARLDKSDPRLSIINSPGSGIVAALNAGLFYSRHPFIARMDADDISHPLRIQTQLEYLQAHPEVQVCGTRVNIFCDKDSTGEGYKVYQQWINSLTNPTTISLNMFIESPIPHPTALMHREHWRALNGYHDCNWPEDYDLWLRAHLSGLQFGKPESILLDWRDHDNRLSRASNRYSKPAFFRARAKYLPRVFPKRQFRIWGAGPTGALLHDELSKNGGEVTDFIDIAPKRINNLKRGKPVIDANNLNKTCDLILTAVNARGARNKIRNFLNQRNFIEGKDYLCAA